MSHSYGMGYLTVAWCCSARIDGRWPSAYGGGLALRSYAALYHYHIVPNGWGDVRGLTGDVVPSLRQVRIFFFLVHFAACVVAGYLFYFFF